MLSTMPFAIAQVDEVGFIFLAQMATSIINICRTSNATDEEILATALCWIVLSTALLGLAMVLTGKLQLAALVHYFPLPVLGGYLAYIGFCKCANFIIVLACSLHDCVPHFCLFAAPLCVGIQTETAAVAVIVTMMAAFCARLQRWRRRWL
jgi:hypothetical protein